MHPLLIVAAILGGLILLILLLLLLGSAKLRIVCREKIRVVVYVLGIPITLVSDKEPKEKKPRDLTRCHNPDRVLRRELRRQKREAAKAEKKRRKAERRTQKKAKKKQVQKQARASKPTPNLRDKLEMILSLLKQLYRHTNGKFRLHVRKMHLWVGSDNAADTAVLYGVILASASCILEWLQLHFIPIRRKPGAMTVQPDYLSEKCYADIDIICSVRLYRAAGIGIKMLLAYRKENQIAHQKAKRRHKANTHKAA